jgi:hypothetical protein
LYIQGSFLGAVSIRHGARCLVETLFLFQPARQTLPPDILLNISVKVLSLPICSSHFPNLYGGFDSSRELDLGIRWTSPPVSMIIDARIAADATGSLLITNHLREA